MFDSDYPIRDPSFSPQIGAGLSVGRSNRHDDRQDRCHADWLTQLCLCVPQAKEAYLWWAEHQTVKKFQHPELRQEESSITDILNRVLSEKKLAIGHFSRDEQELAIIACRFPTNTESGSTSPRNVVACVAVVFPKLTPAQLNSLAKLVQNNIGWHQLLLARTADYTERSVNDYASGDVSSNISASENDRPDNDGPGNHGPGNHGPGKDVPGKDLYGSLANLTSKWLTEGTVDGGVPLCASTIANDLATHFSCERVILATLPTSNRTRKPRSKPINKLNGTGNGKQRILAISGISEVDPRQQCNSTALEIMAVLGGYSDQVITPALENDPEDNAECAADIAPVLAKYAQVAHTDSFTVLSYTTSNTSRLGAIFEWQQDTPKMAPACHDALRRVTENGLELLALKVAASPTPRQRLQSRTKTLLANVLGEGHLQTKLMLAGFMIFCAFATLFPVEFRISAPMTLEGSTQRAIVAPFEGYVQAAHVQAGMTVEAGQTLIELDQSKLTLERDKWTSEKAKLTREYDRALADLDQSQAQIIRAQIGQAQAELNLVDNKITRTVIHAPFDGVVISGDLSRSLGAPIARGDVLLEVAPLAGYRVVLSVDERDISNIALAQSGQLTLNALPGLQWPFEVSNVASATPGEDGAQLFRVEAKLSEPNDQLRPGMQGIGKILVGQESLAYIFTRRFIGWLQLNLWSKLP